MTRQEQKQFVRNLLNSIRNDLIRRSAKWPAHWDGHELRHLVADATIYGAMATHLTDRRQRRYRNYLNVVITENLY